MDAAAYTCKKEEKEEKGEEETGGERGEEEEELTGDGGFRRKGWGERERSGWREGGEEERVKKFWF